jgi:hypothetical protein
VIAFLGISYFDQMIVFWFLLLGMISSACYQFKRQTGEIDPVS